MSLPISRAVLTASTAVLLAFPLADSLPAFAQAGGQGTATLQPLHYARSRDYHVRHLKLIFDVNAPDHSAHGDVTNYLAPLRDGLAKIVLDAGANLKILGCRVDGTEAPFTHDGESLTVTPPTPLIRGKEVALEVRYDMPGGGRFGGANGAGGITWIDPRPDQPDRKRMFWTQGETDGNHHWVPCYDYPNDKCTSETITTVPEDWEVVGNGAQGPTTRDPAKRTRTFRWTMKQPHSTYLLSLVAGELDIRKDSWAGVPLYYVVPRGRADAIPATFGNTPDMLSFFSTTLGVKYAWPKFAQCAVFDFPGGMENVSAVTLGSYALTDKRAGFWPAAGLTSHELAHQWFGDLVTCKDWGDIWLNESFATFFEMLYEEHINGPDRYDTEVDSNTRQYIFSEGRNSHPLATKQYANQDAMFESGHTYAKGGVILHMLRRQLGDASFFRGLGHYLRVNKYQPVDSHDLSKAITEETGIDVEPFFDQWVYKPGHPVLDFSWTYNEAGKAVVAHVKQLQDTSRGTPIYDTPLTFALLAPGSSRPLRRERVTLAMADQEFRFPATTRPGAVMIDPDHDLLRELKSGAADAELPTVLRYAPSSLDRLAAVARLVGTTLSDATFDLFTSALHSESSETVASALIAALGKTGRESLAPLLLEQVASKQPGRRVAALLALGSLPRSDAAMTALRSAASSDTELYSVVEAALGSLGKLDTAGSIEILRHQVRAHSLGDQLAAGAVSALAAAKSDAAAPSLLEAVGTSHSLRVRTRAAEALGKVVLNDTAVNAALRNLLKEDDHTDLQLAAIDSLQARKDKDSVAALKELAARTKSTDVHDAAGDAAIAITPK